MIQEYTYNVSFHGEDNELLAEETIAVTAVTDDHSGEYIDSEETPVVFIDLDDTPTPESIEEAARARAHQWAEDNSYEFGAEWHDIDLQDAS